MGKASEYDYVLTVRIEDPELAPEGFNSGVSTFPAALLFLPGNLS